MMVVASWTGAPRLSGTVLNPVETTMSTAVSGMAGPPGSGVWATTVPAGSGESSSLISPSSRLTLVRAANISSGVAIPVRSGISFTSKTDVGRSVLKTNPSIGLSARAASMLAFQMGPARVPPKTCS